MTTAVDQMIIVCIISRLLTLIGFAELIIYLSKFIELRSKVGILLFIRGTLATFTYILFSMILGIFLFVDLILTTQIFGLKFIIGILAILCLFVLLPSFIELSRLWLVKKENIDQHLNYTPKGKKSFII